MRYSIAAALAAFSMSAHAGSIHESIEFRYLTGDLDAEVNIRGFNFDFDDEIDTDIVGFGLVKDLSYNANTGNGIAAHIDFERLDIDGDADILELYLKGFTRLAAGSNSVTSLYGAAGLTYSDVDDLDEDTGIGAELGIRWESTGRSTNLALDLGGSYQDLGEFDGVDIERKRLWIAGFVELAPSVWLGPELRYEDLSLESGPIDIDADGVVYGVVLNITPWQN